VLPVAAIASAASAADVAGFGGDAPEALLAEAADAARQAASVARRSAVAVSAAGGKQSGRSGGPGASAGSQSQSGGSTSSEVGALPLQGWAAGVSLTSGDITIDARGLVGCDGAAVVMVEPATLESRGTIRIVPDAVVSSSMAGDGTDTDPAPASAMWWPLMSLLARESSSECVRQAAGEYLRDVLDRAEEDGGEESTEHPAVVIAFQAGSVSSHGEGGRGGGGGGAPAEDGTGLAYPAPPSQTAITTGDVEAPLVVQSRLATGAGERIPVGLLRYAATPFVRAQEEASAVAEGLWYASDSSPPQL